MTAHHCPSFPCPLCHPYGAPVYWSPITQPGCICPAGAEKTCKGAQCPRRERSAGKAA